MDSEACKAAGTQEGQVEPEKTSFRHLDEVRGSALEIKIAAASSNSSDLVTSTSSSEISSTSNVSTTSRPSTALPTSSSQQKDPQQMEEAETSEYNEGPDYGLKGLSGKELIARAKERGICTLLILNVVKFC
jgi:hypothetical protein